MSQSLFAVEKPHSVRAELFGGVGRVRVWELGPLTLPPFTAALACELEPGASVGVHHQEHFAEIVVCVAGVGVVTVDGRASAFVPGVLAELPLGHTLAFANTSQVEPLRYLIIKAAP